MSAWKPTPFETLEAAHVAAVKFQLNPSSIIDTGQGIRSFETKVGRQRSILAQRTEDGFSGPVLEKKLPKGKKSGAPLQDPNTPSFGQEDRLLTGPWTHSDHITLMEVRAYYQQLGPSTKHRFTFDGALLVVEYPDGDVYEYRQRPGQIVEQRALMSAKGRYLTPYEGPKKAEFKVGPWELCDQQSPEEVEAFWRERYVNFDNVEVIDVRLYRIDEDEYEYATDNPSGELWYRKLSPVK